MPEFKILNNVLEHMEITGTTYKLVELSIDQELTDQINNKYKTSYSLADIEKATDKCLAHEWLKYRAIGGTKYSFLGLTPKGVGAARSKQKSEELKASRTWLKKSSDYIEDHKGILIFLGAAIALATFILKVTGE